MKLATIRIEEGPAALAAVVGGAGGCLRGVAPAASLTLMELSVGWDELRAPLEQAVAGTIARVPLRNVELLAPIARPGKIMAMGLNYADHVAEAGLEEPADHVGFCKQANTVHPPFAPVQIPKASERVDYEVELVFVIGRRGRH